MTKGVCKHGATGQACVCVLLLASKGTGEIPEGRSEHFITVGGADGARRYFVVRTQISYDTVIGLFSEVDP